MDTNHGTNSSVCTIIILVHSHSGLAAEEPKEPLTVDNLPVPGCGSSLEAGILGCPDGPFCTTVIQCHGGGVDMLCHVAAQ